LPALLEAKATFWEQRALIKVLFPTLLRPKKTTSGYLSLGLNSNEGQEMMYWASWKFIIKKIIP
jgi:hypothetical protein